MPENEIQSTFAPPDTASWFDFSWKMEQEMPQRFEEAAKFLVTIISLTIVIMTTALDKLQIFTNHPTWFLVVMLLWLVALLCAFVVLFPRRYGFNQDSVASIKRAVTAMVRFKRCYFLSSTILYFVSLVILFILYLY